MIRGIKKSDVFKDDWDRALFVKRLGQNVIEGKYAVSAWVPMDNLVHLLRTTTTSIAEAVARLKEEG